jgi:hypothetical protein
MTIRDAGRCDKSPELGAVRRAARQRMPGPCREIGGLTPLIFAMHDRSGDTQIPVVFAIGSQLEFTLTGLLLSVVVLGLVLSRFIIKQPAHA